MTLEQPLGPNLRAGDFYLAQRREDVVLGATLEFDRFDRRVDRGKRRRTARRRRSAAAGRSEADRARPGPASARCRPTAGR